MGNGISVRKLAKFSCKTDANAIFPMLVECELAKSFTNFHRQAGLVHAIPIQPEDRIATELQSIFQLQPPEAQCKKLTPGNGLQLELVVCLVPMRRIELPTSPLPRECSTTELHGHIFGVAFLPNPNRPFGGVF